MTNTPTSGRPSDRAIAQAYREAFALGAETYLTSLDQRARELDAAHPVAAEAVDAPVAWRLDAVDPETKWPYFSYTNHPGSVTPAHVPLYLRPLPAIAAQASVSVTDEDVEAACDAFDAVNGGSRYGTDAMRSAIESFAKRIAAQKGGDHHG
jgi:hypothetical protein